MIDRNVDAVFFDLDDTLHDDTTAYRTAARRACAGIAAERGVAAEALVAEYVRQMEAFWGGLRPEDLAVPLSVVRIRLWAAALASEGIDDATLARRVAAEYSRHRASALQPFPEALPLLTALREAGRKTALITNGFAETHREKIAVLRFDDAFDAILIADEVGMVKPDPRVFLHACERLGVAPSASVMVGDRYDRDIRGAAEAGLATIWLNPAGLPVPPGGPQPDAIAGSFAAVAATLGAAARSGTS